MAFPRRLRPRMVPPAQLGHVLADVITALQYLDTQSGPNEAVVPHEVMKRLEKFQLDMVFGRPEDVTQEGDE